MALAVLLVLLLGPKSFCLCAGPFGVGPVLFVLTGSFWLWPVLLGPFEVWTLLSRFRAPIGGFWVVFKKLILEVSRLRGRAVQNALYCAFLHELGEQFGQNCKCSLGVCIC